MVRKKHQNLFFIITLIGIFSLTLSACQVASPTQAVTQPVESPEIQYTSGPTIEESVDHQIATETPATLADQSPTASDIQIANPATPTSQPTPRPTLGPDDWQDFPVFPSEVSERAKEIFQQGLAMGNDPTHFSKLGDCQNITTYFLAIYDTEDQYNLGEEYADLQETIDYYAGSWSRESKTVKGGFNVASVFNPIFSDREVCENNETPLACEMRLHKPSIVLISMEEWWNGDTAKYETYLRKIVDEVIANGAVPVLATKADNLEGDNGINKAIVNLAYEYEIPLWNFWAAVQPIPKHGLLPDGFHLTHGLYDYTDSAQLKRGWVQRNLTALQVLDAVRRGLGGQ